MSLKKLFESYRSYVVGVEMDDRFGWSGMESFSGLITGVVGEVLREL